MTSTSTSSATIFTPSLARSQLAAQKDWNHIDAWLARLLGQQRQPPPAFERNADTLRALLALAACNEAADEERQALARVEQAALRHLRQQAREEQLDEEPLDGAKMLVDRQHASTTSSHLARLRRDLHAALGLEGQRDLAVFADLSVTLGQMTVDAEPAAFDVEDLAHRLVALQTRCFDIEQAQARVDVLARNLASEMDRLECAKAELETDPAFREDAERESETRERQRQAKMLSARLAGPEEGTDKTMKQNMHDATSTRPHDVRVTIDDVRAEEEHHREAIAELQALEAQVKTYHGLPQDADLARLELEQLRQELGELVRQRDEMFEGLVERETPRRVRR